VLSRSTLSSSFEEWRLLRVLLTLGLGLAALALPAATVGAAVIECSGRFPDTDVCAGRLHGGPLAAVAIAVAVVASVAGLGVAVRSSPTVAAPSASS
jgi:hypothetical protein